MKLLYCSVVTSHLLLRLSFIQFSPPSNIPNLCSSVVKEIPFLSALFLLTVRAVRNYLMLRPTLMYGVLLFNKLAFWGKIRLRTFITTIYSRNL